MSDGLRKKGIYFPFWKVVMHAAQPILTPGNFPWFMCPWEESSGLLGSFSYALWGQYTVNGGTIAVNSPDWGSVPKSLARNRVIISIRPNSGTDIVFPGVAGTIGMPGFNSTGVSVAGTAGPQPVVQKMAMPGNGIAIPDEFTPGLLFLRNALTRLDGRNPDVFEAFENILRNVPIDGFHVQVTVRGGRSSVYESGAAAAPDYPDVAERIAGNWDDNSIIPADWRGGMVLTQFGVFHNASLPFTATTDITDSFGDAYAGRVELSSAWYQWRHWRLGKAFSLPRNADRGRQFENWFVNLGFPPENTPFVVNRDDTPNSSIVSVRPDKSGGWWATIDGSAWGTWERDSKFSFRAFNTDGSLACSGPLFDFGNGVTGWCHLGDSDIEWLAWNFQFPAGSSERLDGMNLSVLPAVAHFAQTPYGGITPHDRTMFVLRELGAPEGTFGLESLFRSFQRAYFNTGQEDNPFGVGAYDLEGLNALFTVGRWEEDKYLGGLNSAMKPILLSRQQLFE